MNSQLQTRPGRLGFLNDGCAPPLGFLNDGCAGDDVVCISFLSTPPKAGLIVIDTGFGIIDLSHIATIKIPLYLVRLHIS